MFQKNKSFKGGSKNDVQIKVAILQQFDLSDIAKSADSNPSIKDFKRIAVFSVPFTLDEMNDCEKKDQKVEMIRDLINRCKFVSFSPAIVFFDFTR